MPDFTKKQIEALKRLADRDILLTEVLQLSGKTGMSTFRLDTGLMAAVPRWPNQSGRVECGHCSAGYIRGRRAKGYFIDREI